ncbi:MAG: haloacid dehalogenase type II [Pseudomonadota bacterium]
MKLSDYKALTFDCYGTLIDWESGIIAGLKPLTDRLSAPPARDTILQAHSRLESAHQAQTPAKRYSDLLASLYRRLAEEWGLTVDWQECLAYGRSVADWPAFPDSAEALAYLKNHYKLVILSNVDNASFETSRAKLGVAFDAIYTAEDIGSYKPSDANFSYMLDNLAQLGLAKEDILHTAESLFHDHIPAGQQGLATCWIYRRHDQEGYGATRDPGDIPPVDFRFNSMAELAEAHRRETAA